MEQVFVFMANKKACLNNQTGFLRTKVNWITKRYFIKRVRILLSNNKLPVAAGDS